MVDAFLAPCRAIATCLWWLASSFKLIFWSGAQPGVVFWLIVFALFALWIGSGFLAATIAELAGKKRGEAFIMGLLAPWVYPRRLAATSEVAATEEEIAAAERAATAAEFATEEEEIEEIDGWCRAWFAQIPVDDDGVRQGPFRLYLLDGAILELESIRDLRDDLMVVVNSATGKTLRIKYDNIANFEELYDQTE